MKNTNKKGFTLVELVIVIAVIAILAAVLIPTFTSVINRAKQSAALQELRTELTEIEVVYAMSGVAMQDNVVFEKNGFYFLFNKGALTTISNADAQTYLIVPTKLANGITSWSKTQGAILNVATTYYKGGATTGDEEDKIWNGNISSDYRGVGVTTGAISNMLSHKITVKNEDGKVVGEDSGTDDRCTYGIYDGKTNLNKYGKGYFTYEVVVTYTENTTTKTATYTGVFYIE